MYLTMLKCYAFLIIIALDSRDCSREGDADCIDNRKDNREERVREPNLRPSGALDKSRRALLAVVGEVHSEPKEGKDAETKDRQDPVEEH